MDQLTWQYLRSHIRSVTVIFLAFVPLLGQANEPPKLFDQPPYNDCLALAVSNPEAGLEDALTWAHEGGGLAAQHCLAELQFAMGEVQEAAARLDYMAQHKTKGQDDIAIELQLRRATMLRSIRDWAGVVSGTSQVIIIQPQHRMARQLRAEAFAATKQWWRAIDDVNAVIDQGIERAEVYAQRSQLYLSAGEIDLAMSDAATALSLDPRLADAYLARGLVLQKLGKVDEAAMDFIQAAMLQPTSEAADRAQRALQNDALMQPPAPIITDAEKPQ